MKNKVLIIGGTGFIGYHLIKSLRKKNYDITSISVDKTTKNRIKNVKYIFLDFTKKLKVLDNYFFDIVINLGGYVDHLNKEKQYTVNIYVKIL